MYCFRSYENTSSFYMIITQTNTNLKLHIFTVSIPVELFIQGYSKVRSIQSTGQHKNMFAWPKSIYENKKQITRV